MGRVVGYMLTWTTYGTWLQGDERGWVKDSVIMKGSSGLLQKNNQSLKQSAIWMNDDQRAIVRGAIVESSKRIKQELLAITVRSNHVHIVVLNTNIPIGKIVHRYKRASTYALGINGFVGKVWTGGYDVRYCFDENSLRTRIGYVLRQAD